MKKSLLFLATLALMFATSCKNDKKETEPEVQQDVETEQVTNEDKATIKGTPKEKTASEIKKLTVALEAKSDSGVTGNVMFTEENGVVSMLGFFKDLTEGTHAIHIHEKSDCSSPDGKSTGGHWNPTKTAHGQWGSPDGYHKGDIGNFEAKADGSGNITFTTDEWCLGCGDETKDIIGKAIIVHQGTDDFTTQPTGAAGGRVSCGGIIQ
ncbi:MAG: superoxide dismutase [Bacteroidetes bacterium MedPE-SWsnd-G2]|nr:MAG: superoxide dismutase [Bacteroidetes bacterium MedPE-SWsnd-G2]